ncbi:MAG: matrixin family metalloprotease [Labilithrix sp.]|nr:matrixin family metalloprotease [Labilithrix sp.]MCW5814855.1 matrixin family metalloprotease [Labilithrix sp.]
MRRFIGLAAAAAALFAAVPAGAFCRSTSCRATPAKECPTDEDQCPTTGAKLFWPTSCLSYATNRLGTQDLDPADTRAIIRLAFQAWTDVKCPDGRIAKMAFEERDPIPCKRSEYNKTGPNVNVVLFQDNDWKYRGIDGTLAKTSVTYNDDTGEIYDADIEVNAANNTVTIDDEEIEYDLQAIMTHEVGHFIGIAHSSLSTAVMYASYSPGSIAQRKLSDDDVEAVCAVYPPDSKAACNPEPRNGYSERCDELPTSTGICSTQPAAGGVSYGVAFLFMGSGLLAARARRRRHFRMGLGGRR